MCGIVGIWSILKTTDYSTNFFRSSLISMRDSQAHRGPDSVGEKIDEELSLYLGFCRLSFLDLSENGNQPMEGDRWIVTFNGEIYNYLGLKKSLQNSRFKFKSETDTEVILALLELSGIESLKLLDGMYAISAFDKVEKKLHLFRDPFGEKPLYYFFDSKRKIIAYSSELSGIENSGLLNFEIDKSSVRKYFLLQYIPPPETIYKHVYKLGPGERIEIDSKGQLNKENFIDYFRPRDIYELDSGVNPRSVKDKLIDLLSLSIERRLLADVPIGAFLSSGVDSSLVVSMIKKVFDKDIQTFSVGFKGSELSEHFIASKIAGILGTRHHNLILEPENISFIDELGGLLDEPLADSSCFPTYMISKFARKHVKGIITGDGGDELFGGYPRYLAVNNEVSLREKANGWNSYQPLISISGEYFNTIFNPSLSESFTDYLGKVEAEFNCYSLRNGISAAMRRYDSRNYLPGAVLAKIDRMSMANSLETRTPFLERNLAEFAMDLPHVLLFGGGNSKFILREALKDFLPESITSLPKKGFGFPITPEWLEILDEKLNFIRSKSSNTSKIMGNEISNTLHTYLYKNSTDKPYLLWAAILLENWLEHRKKVIQELNSSESSQSPEPYEILDLIYFQAHISSIDKNYYLASELDALLRFYSYIKILNIRIFSKIFATLKLSFKLIFTSTLRGIASPSPKFGVSLILDPFLSKETLSFLGKKYSILFLKIFVTLYNKIYYIMSNFIFSINLIKLFLKQRQLTSKLSLEKHVILAIHGQYFIIKLDASQISNVISLINNKIDLSKPLKTDEVDALTDVGFTPLHPLVIYNCEITKDIKSFIKNKRNFALYKALTYLNLNNYIFLETLNKKNNTEFNEIWFLEHGTSLPMILSFWLQGNNLFQPIGSNSPLLDTNQLVDRFILVRKLKSYYRNAIILKKIKHDEKY